MDDQQTVEPQGVEEADESGLEALLDYIKDRAAASTSPATSGRA